MKSNYTKNDLKKINTWFKNYYQMMQRISLKQLQDSLKVKCSPRQKSLELKEIGIVINLCAYCVNCFVLDHWDEFYRMRLKAPTLKQAHEILSWKMYGRLKEAVTEKGLHTIFNCQKERLSQSLSYLFQIYN
ncbi:MAG: hypothetical protein HQL12_09180 [Candidatus Omnitrophica bacterium]|nr:hypothetical protein [Candidatus Omnitrophota bacterium]